MSGEYLMATLTLEIANQIVSAARKHARAIDAAAVMGFSRVCENNHYYLSARRGEKYNAELQAISRAIRDGAMA